MAYESAEQKSKHCLAWDFLSALEVTDDNELHLHVLQAMGLVDPQYSHCFLATEVDADGVAVRETLEDPFSSAADSSGAVTTEGSDSATV